MTGWELVEGGRFDYWRMELEAGGFLAIKRITRHGDPNVGRWLWMHRGPEVIRRPPRDNAELYGYELVSSGVAARLEDAKHAACAAVGLRHSGPVVGYAPVPAHVPLRHYEP